MTKDELLSNFAQDFLKSRGALTELLEHNRAVASNLSNDLAEGDFKRLEEAIEINNIILKSVSAFNELYKNTPVVLDSITKMTEGKDKEKSKTSLADLMNDVTSPKATEL